MGSAGAKKISYFRMKKEHLFLQATCTKRNMYSCTCAGTGERD
jgi:hypothetical protein